MIALERERQQKDEQNEQNCALESRIAELKSENDALKEENLILRRNLKAEAEAALKKQKLAELELQDS